MALKRWHFACFAAAVAGFLLTSGIQGTAVESGTVAGASSQEELRSWTDRSGTYRAEAVLVEFKDDTVTLKKKDGTTVSVPFERLSDADRQYVGTFATGASGRDHASSPGSELNDSSALGDDAAVGDGESVRTEARGDVSTQSRARTSYRTTARTTARTTVGSSDSRGTRHVEVEGVGATAEEALKDCFRKAVSAVMGSIIDAETEVKNDRLVLDRILTFTDGFVASYEELEAAHVVDGLVHRRIAATVRRDSLLLACGKAEAMSVDASGLYPEVMTKLERRRNALALLRKTVDMLPESLLQIQVKRPPVETVGDRATDLGVQLIIRVDLKKYDAFRDRMTNILRCLSRQAGTIEAYDNPVAAAWEPARQKLLRRKFVNESVRGPDDMCVVDANFSDIQEFSMPSIARLFSGGSRPAGKQGSAALLIKGESDWRWFDLDEDITLSPRIATVVVAFRDRDGEEIKTTSLSLGPWVPGFTVLPHDNAGAAPRAACMSPSFLYYHSGEDYPNIIAGSSVTVHGGITVENDLLARVSTMDASVHNAMGGYTVVFAQETQQSERGLRRTPPASSRQEEDPAMRALRMQRARATQAAMLARIHAHDAVRQAGFQKLWQQALRRSGW